MSDLDSLLEQFKQPRGAALPPEADQPPLFAELLGGDTERAIHLLQDGADAHHTLPCGLTALHAAVLGGVAGAVPALVAAGVPVDAQLTAPQLLPKNYGEKRSPEAAPAGSTALTLACAVGKPASVQALLAAGAAYQLPTLNADSWGGLFADTAASPWFWAVQWRGARSEAADAAAVRASLLEHVLQRAAAGTLQLQPEQLMALLAVAALAPARTDQLAALAALPGAADKLDTAQRRRLAGLVVKRGDAEAVHALQAGPLRQQPIDPHGSLLQDIANNRRSDALPMASALLQHGTSITLTAINNVVNERTNAPLLELILSSGLPLPKVPRGSKKRSVAMWDGEYGSPEDFHNVCCPFYTLFRRDCHYLMKTPQELRVRMCQALLRAGYRPTVYRSIQLQVLSKSGNSYEPRCLTNFHILRDWGRKGFSKDGTERICCFPGAEPQQDKLLTGDNRLLWMLVEGEPWSPADHHYWPPAFKAAARALLLAHRRGAPVKGSAGASTSAAAVELQASPLSHLPHGLVLAVIAAAAFPLDAWFDETSMQDWLASEFYSEMNLRF